MPRASRQDRQQLLLLPENAYNVLRPHPQAQTLYDYPFHPAVALITCAVTTGPIWLGIFSDSEPTRRIALIVGSALLVLEVVVFTLMHPDTGDLRCRNVETPTGLERIYVLRPLFARRKREVLYGVTGGNSYKSTRVLWYGTVKLRREPALWVVDW